MGIPQGAIENSAPTTPQRPSIQWFRDRYLDMRCSIYIYNEHRGYTAIDRVLEAVLARAPGDTAMIDAISKHRADERKHYKLFRRWFELRGVMPFEVGRTFGHIDRFVELALGSPIDDLDTNAIVADDKLFERLCQVIAITERRGHRQVEILLRHPAVQSDRLLMRIFAIIEKDEPSHWAPYEAWLADNGKRPQIWWERLIDKFIHAELLFVKLPVLFVSPRLKRRHEWADASDRPGARSGKRHLRMSA